MASYSKAKFAVDAFWGFASRTIIRAPIVEASGCKRQLYSSISGTENARTFRLSGSSLISWRTCLQLGGKQNHRISFLGGGKRFYKVDRYRVQQFKPRGPERWFQNPRTVLVVVLVSSGVIITIGYGTFVETIPYTKRNHFVFLSKSVERQLGEAEFQKLKASFEGKILPAIHPQSVRVRFIATNIIEALERGLSHERSRDDSLMALRGGAEGKIEKGWNNSDNAILDNKWVEKSQKKGRGRGSQSATEHLEGLNWEVLVVNEPVVNAFCLPGGKIVVFTGLLNHFKSNAEIATIIGHEVGHVVARHAAEKITKNLCLTILQLILLLQYDFIPDLVETISHLLLRLPFSRRMEMEADYIGLLLIASAGYDPLGAPKVYEKLGKITGESASSDYLSSHPSGKKRAELLSQARVMEEALAIYRSKSRLWG